MVQTVAKDMLTNLDNIPVTHKNVHVCVFIILYICSNDYNLLQFQLVMDFYSFINLQRMATGVLILNGQKAQFAHEAVVGDLVACLVNDSV